MLVQLHTPIPLETPLGKAFAHMVMDYGQEHYLHFICFLNESGECWIFDNREVRLEPNLTMGVRRPPAMNPAPSSPPLPPPQRDNPKERAEVEEISRERVGSHQGNGNGKHANGSNGHAKAGRE